MRAVFHKSLEDQLKEEIREVMTKHHEEMIEKLEATIKEAQFQIEELKKPKSNYPQLSKGYTVDGESDIWLSAGHGAEIRHSKGNMFETKEKAERSNLYKLLNSEYDYWFPGFSEKPYFEPYGLEYFSATYKEWKSVISVGLDYWREHIYRWKRSEN